MPNFGLTKLLTRLANAQDFEWNFMYRSHFEYEVIYACLIIPELPQIVISNSASTTTNIDYTTQVNPSMIPIRAFRESLARHPDHQQLDDLDNPLDFAPGRRY